MTALARNRVMILLVAASLALTLAVFVLTHAGGAGVGNCEAHGYTGPGTLSWWPPGSVCRGGEPQVEAVKLDGDVVPGGIVLLSVLLLAGTARARQKA